jgi:hypothetical protein
MNDDTKAGIGFAGLVIGFIAVSKQTIENWR